MRVCIVGTGNVAQNIAYSLKDFTEIELIIAGRNPEAVERLATITGAESMILSNPDKDFDIAFFCVTDTAIKFILQTGIFNNKLLIHTAGSVESTVFVKYSPDYGVFYPLQTFSGLEAPGYMENIPVFLEGSSEKIMRFLEDLARRLKCRLYYADSNTRMKIHIAAVFACNFTNHMISIASDLLEQEHISYEVLQPLVKKTFEKLEQGDPQQNQTGPAKRNDHITMEKHIKSLKQLPGYEKIYSFVSESIYYMHKK